MRRALASAAFAALLGVGATSTSVAATSAPARSEAYSLAATTRCLVQRGARVTRMSRPDSRLLALRDLSRRTAREVRIGKRVAGMAFSQTSGHAELLVELLQIPKDPYRIQRRENVVVMARPRDRSVSDAVLACLRA